MKKSAFTLAEVLITLAIIGVVAAMTIPSLMNTTGNQELKTGAKKAIASLAQAATMNYALKGYNFATMKASGDETLTNILKNNMQIVNTSCNWTTTSPASLGSCYQTGDGMMYSFKDQAGVTSKGNVFVYVDVNGKKGPNTLTSEAYTDTYNSANNRDAVLGDIYKVYLYNQTAQLDDAIQTMIE